MFNKTNYLFPKIINLYFKIKLKYSTIFNNLIKKPVIEDNNHINSLVRYSEEHHFQFNYGLRLKSGNEITHVSHNMVLSDIIHSSLFRKKSCIKFSEFAALDSYLSWRLSPFFSNITSVDINRFNTEKVKYINKIFGLRIKYLNDDISKVKDKFNIITLLGCTYFLDKPLSLITNIIKDNFISEEACYLYVDFRLWSENSLYPYHVEVNKETLSLFIEEEGFPIGMKYNISLNKSINYINHPSNYTSSIFYRKNDVINFLSSLSSVKEVKKMHIGDIKIFDDSGVLRADNQFMILRLLIKPN